MVKRKVLLVIALLVFTLVCLTGCNFLEKLGIGKKAETSNEPVTLSAPTLSISGTTLSWTRIEHADEYRVRYASDAGTVYRTVTLTSVSVPNLEVGRYAVSVMARSASSGYLDSEYSNQVTYIKSATLTMGEVELFVIDNTYLQVSWSPVEHVSGYEVKVGGGESHHLGATAVSYQLDLPAEEAIVKVRALGDGTLYLDSGWSQAEFDPATVVPAVELDFDLVNGELSLAGVATEATLDQRAFPFEVRGGNTYFDLSGVTLGVAHTFIVTTDERTVYSLYVVDSRPAYWEIEDGQVSWERHSATGLSLSACLYANDVQSVTLQDNAVTSYHVETSGGLRHLVVELGADTLNALPASNYNLVLNYVGQQPGQITAQVTLTNSPFVLGKTEYNYGGGDLTVSIATHGDTIVGLRIGSVNYSDGFTQGVNSLVISSTVLQGREGEVTIKILSELVPSGRTITVAIGSSDLALSQVEYVYDKYDGGNLALQGYLFNEVTLYGGGITASDYTQAVGSNGVTLLAAYLNGLPQGEYRFLSKGVEVDTYFGVTVLDSGASPTNVKLNYDIDDTVAYVTFTCECGGTDHAVVVDGHTVGNGNRLAVSGVDRALQHTVVVSCGTNFKQTSLTVMAPPLAAYEYLNTHFDMDGNTSDLYVDSQEELNAVVKWLSYGGNYDSTQGTYGASSAEMYLSPRFSDGFNLNAALTEATNSFDVPFSSQVGLSMMGNKLTVTITFNSPLIRTTTSGQPYTVSADNRAYLAPAQGSGRGLYIDTVTATQKVLNVVQLANLPMGVRPIFDSSVNSQRAKAVYDAAKVVCDEYLADSMNLYQKVTALYEYLALNVTYDHYTLVWYNLYAYAMSGYYSLSEVKTKTETERLKYTDDPTMSANFARVLACDTLADARAVLDDILHSLTVFDAYGALVDHSAVCDGISDAFRILCLIEGIPCLKVTGLGVTSSGTEAHAWNKVFIEGDWYVVDATWGRNGNYVTHSWLLLPESAVVDDHKENVRSSGTSVVEQLAEGEYNYYRNTTVHGDDLYITSSSEFRSVFSAHRFAGEEVIELEMAFSYNLNDLMATSGYFGSYSTSRNGDVLTIILT